MAFKSNCHLFSHSKTQCSVFQCRFFNDRVFVLNPEKKKKLVQTADPSCRFREKQKISELRCTPILKKWCHQAFSLGTSFFRNWSALEISSFCVFLKNDKDRSIPIFVSGFRTKHLFITTCIKKDCIGPLMSEAGQLDTTILIPRTSCREGHLDAKMLY